VTVVFICDCGFGVQHNPSCTNQSILQITEIIVCHRCCVQGLVCRSGIATAISIWFIDSFGRLRSYLTPNKCIDISGVNKREVRTHACQGVARFANPATGCRGANRMHLGAQGVLLLLLA
jgi:hypothetical protein